MKTPIFVKNGFFIMIWLIILIVIVAALAFRVVACMQKSKEPGETWNLRDKYAANDFGE